MAKGATDIRNLDRELHDRMVDTSNDHRVGSVGVVYNHVLKDFWNRYDKGEIPDFFNDLPGSRHAKKNHAARVTAARANGHGGMDGP